MAPQPESSAARPLPEVLRHAKARFAARFGRAPARAAAAPGRVNLIGEHTDYNDGFVLPMAIERHAVIVADRTAARSSTLVALDLGDEARFDLTQPIAPPTDGTCPAAKLPAWARSLVGVAAQFLARGRTVPNLDLAVTSTVPLGAGLASSAAIEVAMATLLESATGATLDPLEKATMCRQAEHDFAGTPCGIMDQLIATMARPGHALLIDCQRRRAESVPMPDACDATILVADTGVKRALAASAYAKRRAQCAAAARALGVKSLREVETHMLAAADLSPVERQRAMHVVQENHRTLHAASVMRAGDLARLGDLLNQSHESLRDLFGVSCPELDTLVEEARALGRDGGVFGARLTGAGFGGCAIVLCRPEAARQIQENLQARFTSVHGRPARFFTTAAAGPARILTV